MPTSYDWICLGSNLFRAYIIYRFAGVFYNREYTNRKKEVVAYIAFSLVTSMVFIIFHSPLFNIITNIVCLLVIVQLYTDSFIKKIVSVLLIYIINMTADSFIVFIFGKRFESWGIRGVESIFTSLSIFILELLVEKIVDTKNKYRLSVMYGIPLMLLPLSSIFMIAFFVFRIKNNDILILVESLFVLFINTVAFYLYDSIVTSYQEKNRRDLLERQLQSYSNQLQVIEQSHERINSLRHDMKHHLLYLRDMAKKNHNNDIMEYIEEMQDFINNPKEYVHSGNDGIDAILNYMVAEAKKLTDYVNVNVCIPEDIVLNQFDINIILGNLLQNALYALEKTDHRVLDINIEYEKEILYIYITNTYSKEKGERKKQVSTLSIMGDSHGIGLNNVKRIVDKYNGTLKIEDMENYFVVDIMLYLN